MELANTMAKKNKLNRQASWWNVQLKLVLMQLIQTLLKSVLNTSNILSARSARVLAICIMRGWSLHVKSCLLVCLWKLGRLYWFHRGFEGRLLWLVVVRVLFFIGNELICSFVKLKKISKGSFCFDSNIILEKIKLGSNLGVSRQESSFWQKGTQVLQRKDLGRVNYKPRSQAYFLVVEIFSYIIQFENCEVQKLVQPLRIETIIL